MAGSQRVQTYLERHKIGALFEDLMGKVIADQPDEPVQYLIRTLERKSLRQSHVRKSGEAEGLAVPKERGYDKPWQTHCKKTRPRDSSGERVRKSAPSKPEWDHRTQTTGTFEELWDDGRKSRAQRSGSPTRKLATQSWTDNSTEDDYLYTSYGYSGPRRRTDQTDPLDGEFGISKETVSSNNKTSVKISAPKNKGQQMNSLKHKQELQKLILSKKSAEDSGIEEDRDSQQDDAVELLESADDLRNEGVTNVKASKGVATRSSNRHQSSQDTGVRVSICARCAKVMSGEPSESAPGVGRYGQLEDSDYEVDKDFPASRPQSAVTFSPDIGAESDEEFESVSQVTGPRRPVWQDDSDAESVTPRKGKHMFSSSTVPAKGRPMYSPEHAAKPSNLKQTAAVVAHSTDFRQAVPRGQGRAVNQTWSPNMDSSDKSKDVKVKDSDKHSTVQEDDFVPRSASTIASGRGGWNVYEADDGTSSYYGSPGAKGRKDTSGPY